MIDYFAETFKSERTNGSKGEMKRFSINNKKVKEKINKKIHFFETNMKKMENSEEFECFIEGIDNAYNHAPGPKIKLELLNRSLLKMA